MTLSWGFNRMCSIRLCMPSSVPDNFECSAWTKQPTLSGEYVTLEPMTMSHVGRLFQATPAGTFDFFPMRPRTWDVAGFESLVGDALADPSRWTFAVVSSTYKSAKPRIVGSSSLLDMRPAHKAVEIGATWYSSDVRGTVVNPESKLLLLKLCFDVLGCERVQLKCDARNQVSQRAIAKIGATFEGTLRKHMTMPDDFQRDTVMFSIIREEWPRVRSLLKKRIVTM